MACFLILAVVLALLVLTCVYLKHSATRTFRDMGVDTPPVTPFFGHLNHILRHGFLKSQMTFYNMYKDKKVYGLYDLGTPAVYITDLDMIKDVFIKHFNSFTDRRPIFRLQEPFHDNFLTFRGDRWKHVRTTVSPTFSSSRVKKMCKHVERCAKQLLENLREKQERNEEINLKDTSSFFTIDVIAGTGFGIDVNSLKNVNHPFAVHARKAIQMMPLPMMLTFLFPSLAGVFASLGIHVMNRKSLQYLANCIDTIMLQREQGGETGKMNDFLDLISAKDEEGLSVKGVLTPSEIHGVAMNLIFAGFDTISQTISFTLFLLAMHPQCLQRAQAEIDDKIGCDMPNYDNVQELLYLDMCINETLRIYPAATMIDRQCTEDVIIQGIHIPKGMAVAVPIYCLHHDPELWTDPEKFDPERFQPELKASRNPYCFIPFGHGPRNCIGMRLGLMELKVTLASVLQRFTPVPCSKTVYPIVLIKSVFIIPKDGLWVKMEARK